jgi:uncharacterized OB-fold protein
MSESKVETATTKTAPRAKIRAPRINDESRPFWEATTRGELLVKHCTACGENHYFPRTFCPFCFSDATEWLKCSGRGSIYTYSVSRRGEPYAIAYVTLDEGPTMLTNLIDCDFDKLAVGQAVKVKFVDTGEGSALPFFVPG